MMYRELYISFISISSIKCISLQEKNYKHFKLHTQKSNPFYSLSVFEEVGAFVYTVYQMIACIAVGVLHIIIS